MPCGGCSGSRAARDEHRARCVRCFCCGTPEREGFQPVTCAGQSVMLRMQDCPRQKMPRKDGTVRGWLWSYYGVPWYERALVRMAAVVGVAPRLTGSLPGCGCVKPAKDAWMWMKAKAQTFVTSSS